MRRFAAIGLLVHLGALAQEGRQVRAALEQESMRVGEQVVLRLSAPADGPAVEWPVIGDTLTSRIEVIHAAGPDTMPMNGRGAKQAILELKLTAFDTGYWAIPPLRFRIDGKEAETNPLLLRVQGVPIDSSGAPRPLKPLIEAPFSPLWWAREHAAWLAGAAAIIALAALVLFLRKRKPTKAPEAAPVILLPLHEQVLAQLQALERERLWQLGEHKAYQSRLTDILRGYIEERYHVPALERTTDELLHELRVSQMGSEHQMLLANMLRAADLVKFAKAVPTSLENEQMMTSAIRFVRETAQQIPATHAA
ncbi:MAG: hypothetical protein IPM46_14985 [Flavobacteriales bacterium]|nr:hypothetical protein [Flavobacteriales bacterium]